MAAIVEQGIDCLLQHSFLITNDDIRSLELKQVLETIVAVDDSAIEIVQVAGGETAAFQRHEWTQIRWNNREHIENHPIRTGM